MAKYLETSKSYQRRIKENWFDKYAPKDTVGIDIGCNADPLYEHYRKWDQQFGDGDATLMEGVKDESYDVVYASHILEHIKEPVKAVKNWYRILKPNGHLIIIIPHRDLYERKKQLPSVWNADHKYFYLPEKEEAPHTKSFKKTILDAIPQANIVLFRVLDEGYDYNLPINKHPVGEYSIEAIIKKKNITLL